MGWVFSARVLSTQTRSNITPLNRQNEQILIESLNFRDHLTILSTFRAENTPKCRPLRPKKNQTLPKQLYKTSEKSPENDFFTNKMAKSRG